MAPFDILDHLNSGELLHNRHVITRALTLPEITYMAERAGETAPFTNALYEDFFKTFFPMIPRTHALSPMEDFEHTLRKTLQHLQEKEKLILSPSEFFEAARGKIGPLIVQGRTKDKTPFSPLQESWLKAIAFSYGAPIVWSKNTMDDKNTLKQVASFMHLVADLSFLKKFFDKNNENNVLIHLLTKHDTSKEKYAYLFYAAHGYLPTIEDFLESGDLSQFCVQIFKEILQQPSLLDPVILKFLLDHTNRKQITLKNIVSKLLRLAEWGEASPLSFLLEYIGQEIAANDKAFIIFKAVVNDHMEVAMLTLQHPTTSQQDKIEAFRMATANRYPEVVIFLIAELSSEISPIEKGKGLEVAALKGNQEIVEILLHYTNEIPTASLEKALQSAAENGPLSIVPLILKYAGHKISEEKQKQALLTAKERRATDIFSSIFDKDLILTPSALRIRR